MSTKRTFTEQPYDICTTCKHRTFVRPKRKSFLVCGISRNGSTPTCPRYKESKGLTSMEDTT